MLVIKKKNQIVAYCPSNKRIDGSVLFEWTESVVMHSEYVPRIGECINDGKNRMRVVDVEYSSDGGNDHLDAVTIWVDSKRITCNFYQYVKAFSHEYDYMKSKYDPTRVEDYDDYATKFPETEAEWLKDLRDLENGITDPNRRNVRRS